MTLGKLYIEAQSYVPMLLENVLGLSFSGTCWPLGGAWFQCRYTPVFLPGEYPWIEEPGGLQSVGLQRVGRY